MSTQTDKTIAVIKGLIMDGVAKANSGHPGGAMSSSDYATILFSEFLNFNPDDAGWFNRDRFILSAGHESMLLYGLLHLSGFISLDDIKNFRQLGSLTPGHPEVHLTPGVEATTGPLGQGFAMSVGFASAEAFLREKLGSDAVDHYTYVLSSDGDIQEPIALGAASLAGLWGLGKLIAYYDSNKIQLAGPCAKVDCTDHRKIFEGMCWQVIEVDGHNHDEIRAAIKKGQLETSKPTIIIGHTTMAKGCATMEGSHETHGAPLKPEEIAATKEKLGLPANESFHVPADVVEVFRARFDGLRKKAADWQTTVDGKLSDADFAEMWGHVTRPRAELVIDWPTFTPGETMATRKAWGTCLNTVMDSLPTLVGGSADLDPSNQTAQFRKTYGDFAVDGYGSRNLAFGVREFPMAAIMNGMQLHGGLLPFGATFLTFSDYCRNAIRMSSLQDLPVLYVFTHDSFWVGEDGPTHQPIEHISSLRLIPNVIDLRPADANETAICLDMALKEEKHPSTIFLTRQGLPILDPAEYPALKDGPRKGGYVLKDCDGTPDLILIGSGSEVSLALETAKLFKRKVRVVSMPSTKLFDDQPDSYKNEVLPPEVTARAAAEAGRTTLWYKYVGTGGVVLGLDHFGASAPGNILSDKYGFTPENFARMIREKFQENIMEAPQKNLALDLVRVTEAAALACARWLGKGDKISADQAAVDAMRLCFNTLEIEGRVMIGEGEKDDAPMLFNGEKLGLGGGPKVDIAVDPLEGTNLLANGRPNAISVVGVAPAGSMFDPGPSYYMQKLVVPAHAKDVVDIEAPTGHNLKLIAHAMDKDVDDLVVFVLDKPRHKKLISEIREAGARIQLHTDGDITGSLMAIDPRCEVDVMMGTGGTPEGVLSAIAIRIMGGEMFAKLDPQKQDEKNALSEFGMDVRRVLTVGDLVKSQDLFFAATGISGGTFLKGVAYHGHGAETSSLVMRGKTGTIRYVEAIHNWDALMKFSAVEYDQTTLFKQAKGRS